MQVRLFPPIDISYQSRTVNGRSYAGVPGQVLDVVDFDAAQLEGNGWVRVGLSGSSAERPTGSVGRNATFAGMHFFDTTMGKTIVYDGATWRDPADGSSV